MKEPKKKRSKKKKYIILFSVLAVIIAAGTAVVLSQRNNIATVRYFLTYSPEELRDRLAENEQRILDAVEEHLPVTVHDLTDEEKELMASDELSKEDAVGIIVERTIANSLSIGEQPAAADQAREDSHDYESSMDEVQPTVVQDQEYMEVFDLTIDTIELATAEESTSYDDTTSYIIELIAEVYVLRAYFTNRLEQMHRAAIDEYLALSGAQQSEITRMDIGIKYLNLAGELEAECDRLMDDIVARFRRTGGDTSLINDIMFSYAEEKSLKKAYYMSLYS
jgi:hypothetical protein